MHRQMEESPMVGSGTHMEPNQQREFRVPGPYFVEGIEQRQTEASKIHDNDLMTRPSGVPLIVDYAASRKLSLLLRQDKIYPGAYDLRNLSISIINQSINQFFK